ncbi:hypothetical protein K469DRAFT_709549 [Zopfia rhizophila CBS 207.26]|uniref:TORC1 subunit TCO89 domain-containing protein n=1 Tax=Zopfia rhizophila CBS 207.26 TaxID=1314779 RepID=A0A6A6ESP9_9PEZI|nr:hypothetical protein K469DRAFT_709549 [Zopfia rhizophila CBS 207.26]
MASSSQDAHSQPKRPAAMARQSSTSSHVSQSPSDTHHKAAHHKAPKQHVVGQSRIQRNTSFGKNLNKLNKLNQAHGGDGNTGAKHHRRSHSGNSNSNSAPSSPRLGFKRNASSGGIVRAPNHSHTHTTIRKNHSSGHLSRQGSSKNALKSSKSEIAPPKRSLAHPGKARQHSPDAHPTVHFDIGNEEGPDDAWTEESASQSPTTTRSNTRSNSVILEPHKAMEAPGLESKPRVSSQTEVRDSHIHNPPNVITHQQRDRLHYSRQTNGSSHHHSRPPDADMITSRLLQRSSSHNPPPQMSSIAATVVSDSHNARILSQSAGSTLVDTPGRDLVSRFMDGDGSAGTPKDSSFLPSRNSPQTGSDFDKAKRNKSAPNMADQMTPSRSQSRRSGTSTPTDLPPSRTQQKLMLQRASSNIEPQKLVPVILPRTGGPTFLHSGMTYTANGEGRLDPRLQQQFNHVAVEYNVVRRYRNPLADAIVRLEQIPGTPRKTRVPRSATANGFISAHGSSSLSTSLNESGVETDGSGTRRSRVSFENDRGGRHDGDAEGRQSFESDNGIRNEAEEICRRLWESTEVVEGD